MLKLLKFLLNIIIVVNLITFSKAAEDLTPEEVKSKNAVVLVYGESYNENIHVLLAYEKRKFWTLPGGAIKKNLLQTARIAAAEELYEETAAFPKFSIFNTLNTINSIQDDRKFCYNKHTMIYAMPVIDSIEDYNIGENWQNRVKDLEKDYQEMTQWAWVPLDVLKKEIELPPNYKPIYNLKGYVLASLKEFDEKIGLKNLQIDKKEKKEHIDQDLVVILNYYKSAYPHSEFAKLDIQQSNQLLIRANKLKAENKLDGGTALRQALEELTVSPKIDQGLVAILDYYKSTYPHSEFAKLDNERAKKLLLIANKLKAENKLDGGTALRQALEELTVSSIDQDLIVILNYYKSTYPHSEFAKFNAERAKKLLLIASKLKAEHKIDGGTALRQALNNVT